ncbi:MAG TPA: YdbH domain-containing protein [Opitutaceae bacterium]|nr:YdbH domain-containing protein [Opitutaceae bacterium]
MKMLRPMVVLLCGALCGRAPAATEIVFPPVSGMLSGEFKPLKVSGAPSIRWSADIRDAGLDGKNRAIELAVNGDGMTLRASVMLSSLREGTWKISEGELDLAKWFPSLAKLSAELGGFAVKGTVTVSGAGTISAGVPSGTLQAEMSDGRLEQTTDGWTLDGVTFAAELAVDADGFRTKSLKPFEAKIGTVTTSRFGARNVLLRGMLNEDRTVELSEARVEIAGGEVTVDPTTVTLSPFAAEGTLHIVNVGLQDLVALVPASLTSAEGRMDGTVRVGWSTAGGFHLGAGDLAVGKTEATVVRLAPKPGFLTQSMPKRFEPLPTWTGPLSKWLSADNPAYSDMAEIETGRASLQVDSLSVQLTPEGDADGRTAKVRMKARPVKEGGSVKSVAIDVNLTGRLDDILRFGLNQEFSIQVQK